MPQSSRAAGKHRRPGKHRKQERAAHQPGAPALMGTAVLASAAAAFLHVPAAAGSNTPMKSAKSLDPSAAKASASTALASKSSAVPVAHITALANRGASKDAAARQTTMLKNLRAAPRASRSVSTQQRAITIEKLQVAEIDWVKPVLSYSMSAGFGEASRLWSRRHTGQDFAAPTGTPVHAVGAGSVVFATVDGAYGRKVIVRHADGTETWYAHLSAFEVKVGDTVKPNSVVGLVGSTGNSTGPHLHFEVRPPDGEPVEPMAWLRAHGVKV